MFFSLLMLVVAGILIVPVITGKGKLLSTENIKKDKIPVYKKWMRIIYGIMIVIVLLMSFFNFVEKVAYTLTYYYEFTEDYVGVDGQVYPAGISHTADEMRSIIPASQTSGSLCAPAEGDPLPVKYIETTYTLKEKYSFLSSISYKTARTMNFVCLGLSLAAVFTLYFFINIMTDKKAKQQNSRAAKQNPVRPSMPRGAFDFSEYKDEVEVKDDMFCDETKTIPTDGKKKK